MFPTFNTTSAPAFGLNSSKPSDLEANAAADNCSDYPADFSDFKTFYGSFHMYFCLVLCPVGVISNVVNVVVLNQKNMRSPTNLLLTGLAVSDGLIMAFYIPFNGYFLLGNHLLHSPYPWVMYLYFYLATQNCLHAFSSCLIVALSIFRLIYTRSPNHSQIWCSFARVKLAVVISAAISVLVSIPYIMYHRIVPADAQTVISPAPFMMSNGSKVQQPISDEKTIQYRMNFVNDATSRALLFWTHGIVLKLLPILLLACLSASIIHSLRQVDEKKRTLLSKQKDKLSKQSRRTSRTTKMLLTIVLIFICAYLPQAIFIVLNASLGVCFLEKVYDNVGDVMDLLTLVNNGINFVLYCIMSKRFRETFICLFFSFFCCEKSRQMRDGNDVVTVGGRRHSDRSQAVYSMALCKSPRS